MSTAACAYRSKAVTVLLDTNVWSYVRDAGRHKGSPAVKRLLRECQRRSFVVCAAPSVLMEVCRFPNNRPELKLLRDDLLRVIRRAPCKLEPDWHVEGEQLLAYLGGPFPEVVKRVPDESYVRQFRDDWKIGYWEMIDSDVDDMASHLSSFQVDSDRDRSNYNSSKLLLEGATARSLPSELWRQDVCSRLNTALDFEKYWPAIDPLRDYLFAYFDLRALRRRGLQIYRALMQAEANDLPSWFLREQLAYAQLDRSWGSGNVQDRQHAVFLPVVKFFLTSDRRYFELLNYLISAFQLSGLGQPILLRAPNQIEGTSYVDLVVKSMVEATAQGRS